jgi:hypothetical protein
MYGDVVWPEFNSVLSSSTGRVLISDTPVEIDQPVPGRYPAVPISFFVPDRKVPILWFSILQNTGTQLGLILQFFSRSISNASSEGWTSDLS